MAALYKMVCCQAGNTTDDSALRGKFRHVFFYMGLLGGDWCRVWFMRPTGESRVSLHSASHGKDRDFTRFTS